jgi:hypothetical protein
MKLPPIPPAPAFQGFRLPAATILIVAFLVSFDSGAGYGVAHLRHVSHRRAPLDSAPARVWCARPNRLRLRRFEDRSAQLLCAGRIVARVSVPG